jgi:hypothetical protein
MTKDSERARRLTHRPRGRRTPDRQLTSPAPCDRASRCRVSQHRPLAAHLSIRIVPVLGDALLPTQVYPGPLGDALLCAGELNSY